MKIQNFIDIEETEVTMEGTKGAKMRMLISDKDGADNFAMRMFAVASGGHTPFHFHNYEHEVFVLEGRAYSNLRIGNMLSKQAMLLLFHQMKNTNL